jgi:hypothetical protein
MAEASVEIPEGRQFIANSETRKRGSFYAFAAIGMVGKAAEAPGINQAVDPRWKELRSSLVKV